MRCVTFQVTEEKRGYESNKNVVVKKCKQFLKDTFVTEVKNHMPEDVVLEVKFRRLEKTSGIWVTSLLFLATMLPFIVFLFSDD